MIDTSKSSRFPLGENIPGVCLGRCCWSLETCWRGRIWQDGKQNVKQMRSKKNLCRICNHLIPFVHIGDWQMNFRLGNTFFSSAAQDVRYYRRSLQCSDELMMVLPLFYYFVPQNDTTPSLSVSLRTAGSVDGSALRDFGSFL